MSHSLGYGTSSGDLNTGGNLSESSFLEALFGLELGPTDFTEFHRSLPYADWDFADVADDADFLLCCLLVPQIPQIFALCVLGFRR